MSSPIATGGRSKIPWEAVPEGSQPLLEQDVEANILLRERLAKLRKLLALRFSGRLSAPQIAVVVGHSHVAVKKELTRTLQKLKEHYRER
jgi:DNA-directed RNA polymerase specialized sigma24 family protein